MKRLAQQLQKIHHVAIIVSDYEKAKAFYVEKLGFEILRESSRPKEGDWKLDLRMGNQELEIFWKKDAPARLSYPEACGLRHLAFWVDDIDAAVKALQEAGIATEEIRCDEFTGKRMTFFRDPDGLPLELHE